MIWYESNNPNGFATGKRFSIDKPSVTIMAAGMGGDSLGHWHFVNDGRTDGRRKQPMNDKPPYYVPSMEEIRKIKWNGLNAISTFSGCGGSSLGYRMAGFKVLWANEFVPIAQESYRANMAPYTILDGRDIRQVKGSEILKAIGLKKGELDLLYSSPPCQAFSTAGKREKGWGKDKVYEHGATQKNETLFDEFIRLVEEVQPKSFVAENVSGLVKGVAKGMFLDFLKRMKAAGYVVSCRVLDASWLGVPQMRQRTIFIGMREDLGTEPTYPKPLPYRYSVRDALPHIGRIDHDESGEWSQGDITDQPAPTVRSGRAGTMYATGASRDNRGAYGNGGDITDLPSPTVLSGSVGTHWIHTSPSSARVVHDTSGTHSQGDVTDRPSPTITNGVNGMNSCHFKVVSETEKRKFTIDELKRICAFPDDFILKGTYAQMWERLGNSVPPVMMKTIASCVRDSLLSLKSPTPKREK